LVLHRAEIITDVVEEMHAAITQTLTFDPSDLSQQRMHGIPGLVYRSIHTGYHLADWGLNIGLSLVPGQADPPRSPQREAWLAILNGVWGDFLTESHNPLRIEMALRLDGQPLAIEQAALQTAFPQAAGRLLLLAHGLCMNDLQWSRDGHDHGTALASELGYTPLYLHYNSGLHISTNGRRLAELLESLVQEWPQPVEELVILSHSMGGLVVRSACYYGELAGHTWRSRLSKLVFLGTPHHGSPLERVGNWTEDLLRVSRFSAPYRRLGMSRSAGITDLRYGSLHDEDWAGLDRFARQPDPRRAAPLPEGVTCYALAACRRIPLSSPDDCWLGDGLVPVDSALGEHPNPELCLGFAPEHKRVWNGLAHNDLLSHPEVYEQIRRYLTEPGSQASGSE